MTERSVARASPERSETPGSPRSNVVKPGFHSPVTAADVAVAADVSVEVSAATDALNSWTAGVTLVTVADGRDDVGATVSAFCPVSSDPPMVLVSLMSGSYLAEVFGRAEEPVTGFAVVLLAAGQRVLAGRFAAEGRPGARLMVEDVPHHRGEASGALIVAGGLAALECAAERVLVAGDHLLVVARITNVPYVTDAIEPLIRFRRGYR